MLGATRSTERRSNAVLTPADLSREVSRADEACLIAAERLIDEALHREYGNRPEIWVGIRAGWSVRICDELIRRYEGAGWCVRRESDQRDGDALVFSVRKGCDE